MPTHAVKYSKSILGYLQRRVRPCVVTLPRFIIFQTGLSAFPREEEPRAEEEKTDVKGRDE